MATNNPPGTPPYEGEAPPARTDPGGLAPGGFLERDYAGRSIPMEGYADVPDRMESIQTPLDRSPLPAMAPNAVAAPPTPQDLAAGQQQASAPSTAQGLGLKLQGPSFTRPIGAGEFYQGQERPANYQTSGGDQFWVPSAGRVPMSVLADRATAIQKKRADLEEGMKKLFGGDDFKGKAAPPYERAYQQYVNQQMTSYVDDWAKAYHGGNRNAAMKDIYTSPDANRQYQAHLRDLAAVGENNKYKYDQYEKLLTDVNDNKAWVSPETKASLDEFVSVDPFNSGKTAAQLADTYKRLDHQVSRDSLWNTTYLPRIKEEFDTLQAQGKVVQLPGGGFKFLEQTETRNLDRLKKQVVNDMVDKYGIGSKAEIESFVDSNMPRYSVTEDKQLSVPSGGSSANKKRSGWNNGGYDTGTGIRAVPESTSTPIRDSAGNTLSFATSETIRLYRDVDGEQVDLKPQEFKDEDGTWQFMKPSALTKYNGQWWIEGTVYARPREQVVGGGPSGSSAIAALNAIDEGGAPAAAASTENTELVPLRTKRVPLSRNNEFRANYVDPDAIMAEYHKGNGGPQAVDNRVGGKTLAATQIKGMVGNPAYEGYSEQELIDYYKSQGYTIK